MATLVDVYPYRWEQQEVRFLILKRAEQKPYAGQWRMVGGKVEGCEAAWQSGLRELREETGLFPQLFWTVPSVNSFYDARADTVHQIPVFAAEVKQAEIALDEEHTDWKWITIGAVKNHILWPEQQRLMTLIHTILTNQKILSEWKIPL